MPVCILEIGICVCVDVDVWISILVAVQFERACFVVVRSFAKPPQAVQDISECIVVMRGYKDISWKTAKGMMAEGNFLKTLQVRECHNNLYLAICMA